MGFERFVANRYLRSPRKDRSISIITTLSVIGVAIGVMALIVSLSLMNGFERDLRGALQRVNGDLTVFSMSPDGFLRSKESSLMERMSDVADIQAYAPFTQNQALIVGQREPMFTMIKGIDISQEPKVTPINFFIRTESFETKRDNSKTSTIQEQKVKKILSQLPAHFEIVKGKDGREHKRRVFGILIGSQLAKELGVDINDWVTVMSVGGRLTPMGELPRVKRFKVVGFFESGLPGFDEFVSVMDINISQKIFKKEGRISGLTLSIKNRNEADKYKEKLQTVIGFPYVINSWIDQNRNLFAMFRLEKFGLAVIMTMIILIAAFNIISSLVMLVNEKNKDIAILKAMGTSNKSIRKIFMMQGTIIGLMGTVIGEILGLLICWVLKTFDIINIPSGVYVSNRIPVDVQIWQVILIAGISLLICFTVTILPSRKASNLDPVEGLRNE